MTALPESVLVDSWRVWSTPTMGILVRAPDPGPPELFTVQVHTGYLGGVRGAQWWDVRVWCHWVPHWWDRVGVGDAPGSLAAARSKARRVVEVLGGRCYQGVQTIATDAPGLGDRWLVLPVDPPPPWCTRWPGPQPWQDQLGTTPGSWGG